MEHDARLLHAVSVEHDNEDEEPCAEEDCHKERSDEGVARAVLVGNLVERRA